MTTTPPDGPADDDVRRGAADDAAAQTGTQTLPPPPQDGPRVGRDELRDLSRLRRSRDNRRIAGVGAGLARHLDLDPLVVRVTLVVLVFFGGAGLVVYLACWLLVPLEGQERALVSLDPRNRSVALVVAGGVALVCLVGDTIGGVAVPWPLVVLGALALLLVAGRTATRGGQSTAAGPPPEQPGASYAAVPPGTDQDRPAEHRPYEPRPYRGPVLFWFALAGIPFALGLLGLADVAGLAVTDSAYPALALTVIGALLVLGAFWGRTGGLIALGLVAALVTVAATADVDGDAGRTVLAPTSAAQLDEAYTVTVGEIVLDLSGVEDLDALDGRVLEADATLGAITVIVPDGLDVEGRARASGAGTLRAFGDTSDTELDLSHDGGPDAPVLTIDAEVALGEITIRDEQGVLR